MHWTQKRRAARHEAGHVIAALYYDIHFSHVRIGGQPNDDGYAFGGGVHGIDGTTSHHNWITIYMSGVAGQYADREKPLTRLSHADLFCTAMGDYEGARYHIDNLRRNIVPVGETVDMLVDEGVAIAHRLIRSYHTHHAAITAALLEKGKMTYHDCMQFWVAPGSPAPNGSRISSAQYFGDEAAMEAAR